MKTNIQLAIVSACFLLHSAFGQGALTPPGAPAPTMRTLDQLDAKLEKRTPISTVPFSITQPGSYYLTTNVFTSSNAIIITANGVSLDLGGWTIFSTATNAFNGGTAILLNGGVRNVTIQNGFIQGGVTNNGSGFFSGGGFTSGITYSSSPAANVLVAKVSVFGCQTSGIYFGNGDSTVVESCTVRSVGINGITASTVKACGSADCGNQAISGDVVSDCRGAAIGNSVAIVATTAQNCFGYGSGNCGGISASTAQNCFGQSSGSGYGILAATAQNCVGFANGSGTGIIASDVAIGCRGQSVTGTGLSAFIANSCHGVSTSGPPLSATHNVNSF